MNLKLFQKLVGDRGCQWPYFNFVLKMCWSVGFGCCLNLTWRLKVNTSLKHMVHELRSFCHQPLLFFPTLGSRTPESPPFPLSSHGTLGKYFSWHELLHGNTCISFRAHFHEGRFAFYFIFSPLPRNFFCKNEQISLATLQRPVAFPTYCLNLNWHTGHYFPKICALNNLWYYGLW